MEKDLILQMKNMAKYYGISGIEEAKEYALPFQFEKMEKMLEMAIEDHKNQKDFYKLYPTKKDQRKMNKIRKDLIKQGVKFD